MNKKAFQFVLVLIVVARTIVRIFHIDFPGVQWLNIIGGVALFMFLVMWILDWREKQKSKTQNKN